MPAGQRRRHVVLVGAPDLVGDERQDAGHGQCPDQHGQRVGPPAGQQEERRRPEGGGHGHPDAGGEQIGLVPFGGEGVEDEGAEHPRLAVGEVEHP
ncbi:MAG TPA: hypothetical protein VKX24_00165 [Acidimicrobiia bacterium]|nr:hypothetical protein [Acidimicrobiia bacterium]